MVASSSRVCDHGGSMPAGGNLVVFAMTVALSHFRFALVLVLLGCSCVVVLCFSFSQWQLVASIWVAVLMR